MGLSYLSETDLTFLKQLKKTAHGVEFLLTLPAGLDAVESADIAAAFAQVGANRLIGTKWMPADITAIYWPPPFKTICPLRPLDKAPRSRMPLTFPPRIV